MKIAKGLFAGTIIGFTFLSCQKELTVSSIPDPPLPDTLTTGWTKISLAGGNKISDIFFSSATTGYLVGLKIYKSIDGGNTWVSVLSKPGFFNIYMLNDSKGYFVEDEVWETLDGGVSFVPATEFNFAQDVFVPDDTYSFATSFNGFYQTYSGRPWQRILTVGLSVGGGYSSLYIYNTATGWIVSGTGIYKVIGSVTSWQKATVTGGNGAPFCSIYAPSVNIVYVANFKGQVYKSTDGGINFTLKNSLV